MRPSNGLGIILAAALMLGVGFVLFEVLPRLF